MMEQDSSLTIVMAKILKFWTGKVQPGGDSDGAGGDSRVAIDLRVRAMMPPFHSLVWSCSG